MDQAQREERWPEICRELHESGMTREAFSDERGIAGSTPGYWLKRLPESASSAQVSDLVPMGTFAPALRRPTLVRMRRWRSGRGARPTCRTKR